MWVQPYNDPRDNHKESVSLSTLVIVSAMLGSGSYFDTMNHDSPYGWILAVFAVVVGVLLFIWLISPTYQDLCEPINVCVCIHRVRRSHIFNV